ncbi:MAG: type II 3-dehydroquinate dehydratase [Coriobacteriales bacterium]|jgi:3-dehydroquinate dehydratase-2|nr:type II 3-dehydroquinate dehydratase [Coriobacteriales bacterium]
MSLRAEEKLRILVLNGPNLNMLGRRQPEIYGTMTLDELNRIIVSHAESANCPDLTFFQTNHEGQLVDLLQTSARNYDGIVYNPAAHTHYSIAIRDAIAAITIPVVEVHLTDITTREEFRRISVMSDVCKATFMGNGAKSYLDALDFLIDYLSGLSSDNYVEKSNA